MKKILLFLLLLPFVSFGQVANGTETKQNAFRSLSPQTVTSVNYLTTMGTDGTMGRVTPSNLSFAQADTGVLTFAGMTTNTATTINIGAVNGQIIDNETNPLVPVRTSVTYAGATGVTVTTVGSGTASYVMLSSAGVISFQNTFPTSAERKAKIWLGKVSHPAGSVTVVVNEPDYVTSPLAFSRDFFQDLGPYVNNGVFPYANGANLSLNITGGTVTGDGINFVTSRTNPNRYEVLPAIVANFAIRTQTGGATAAVNAITPGVYDNAGTITAIGGGAGASTIQHVEYIPGQGYIVQLGQQVYATFNDAVAAVGRENPSFVRWSNLVNNAIPIGVIVVNKSATTLNNTAQALFFKADKTGDFFGAQAGVATGTLQTSYLNSVVPQITTTPGLGAVTIKRGSAADTDSVFDIQNGAGATNFSIKGNGNTSINGLITGTVTRVLPSGTTFNGQTFNLTSTDNTSAFRNINTYSFPEDGIVNNTNTNSIASNYIVLNKTTNQPSYSFSINESRVSQTNTGSIGSINMFVSGMYSSGTGTIGDLSHFTALSNIVANSYTLTNFHVLKSISNPQNNITNAYGFRLGDLFGSTISRGIDSGVSAGTGKFNIYAQGTADNYFKGALLVDAVSNGVDKVRVGGSVLATGYKVSEIQTAPSSATDTGTAGEIRFTATGIFICTATNTWIKCVGATF